ncbi:MAG: ABC transporter permease [Bdellovibrionales bacterium]|nr:ABC transporter permease [Bdellovibrionales bacterium]
MYKILKNSWTLLSFPQFGEGSLKVILRHKTIFFYQPTINFVLLVSEPLMVWAALGIGLGFWIGKIENHSYAQFLIPALAGIVTCLNAFQEVAYNINLRFKVSPNHWNILQSPLRAEDVASGEILWATIKGILSGLLLLFLGCLFNGFKFSVLYSALLILIPGAILFSSTALLIFLNLKGKEKIGLIYTLVLIPLAFLSHSFFPTFDLLGRFKNFLWISPLVHVTYPLRNLCWDQFNSINYLNLALLWFFAGVSYNLALRNFNNKINSN